MASIAFIGLGKMGVGMASRLLEAGHRVSIYNRTAAKADAIVSRGARLTGSPKEACAGADAVFCMVSDDTASRAIWLGADGILASQLAPGALAIEGSTLSHRWVMDLAAQAEHRGLRYIDSPVTGLPADAASGALTMLVGAAEEDLERARPVLAAVSNRIIRFGSVGAGTAYKLIINMIGAIQIASAAEGMALAQRAGLDLATVADAIATGQAASPQVIRNVRRIVAGDHDRNVVFTAALRLKDVEYALRMARELSVGAPFGELAAGGLWELCATDGAHINESGIFDVAASR
ncbi:MAG: NAD(P)-dependent oxidoreductase [Steroidobacteraceae bacterium]